MVLASASVGVQAQSVTDMTSAVTNPTFDTDKNGWTQSLGNLGQASEANSITGRSGESWAGKAADNKFDFNQTIKNLPAGRYLLSADMFNSLNGVEGTPNAGQAGMYVIVDGVTSKVVVPTSVEQTPPRNMAKNYGIVFEVPEGGKDVVIGFKNFETMTARWFVMDNIRLHSGIPNFSQELATQINKIAVTKTDEWLEECRLDASRIQASINTFNFVELGYYTSNNANSIAKRIQKVGSDIDAALANYDAMETANAEYTTLSGLLPSYLEAINKIEDEATKALAMQNYESLQSRVDAFLSDAETAYETRKLGAAAKEYADRAAKIKEDINNAINADGPNAIAYSTVIGKINSANDAYALALRYLFDELSGENQATYGNLYLKALGDMNVYKRSIASAEADAKVAYENGTLTNAVLDEENKPTGKTGLDLLVERLEEAINGIRNKQTEYINWKTYHLAACEDIAKNVQGSVKVNDAYVVNTLDWLQGIIGSCTTVSTKYSDDLAGIQTKIDELQANVDAAKENREIQNAPEFYAGYTDKKQEIAADVRDLYNIVKPEVDNWDAYQACVTAISNLQKDFDAKKKAVNALASEDGKYKVSGKYAVTEQNIQDKIDELTLKAEEAYLRYEAEPANAAVAYKPVLAEAINGTEGLQSVVDYYSTDANDALLNYNDIAEAIASYETGLTELKEIVKTPAVTIGGDPNATETYGNSIEQLQTNINNLQVAVTAALAKEDVAHYNAMMELTANPGITAQITKLKASYAGDEATWNAELLKAAKERMIADANNRITQTQNQINDLDVNGTESAAKYGLAITELREDVKSINDVLTGCAKEVQDADADPDATKAIAVLSTTVETLNTVEADKNALLAKAEAAAAKVEKENTLQTEANAQISELQNLLDEVTALNEAAEQDRDSIEGFRADIQAIQVRIDAETKAVADGRAAETLYKDVLDAKVEGKTVPGIYSRIEAIQADIVDLKADVQNATDNYQAKEALNKLITALDFTQAFADARTGIAAATTGTGLTYFNKQVTTCESKLNTIKSDITKVYKAGTAVDNKSALINRINSLYAEVNDLAALAKANQEAYNAQNTDYTEVDAQWTKVFEAISSSPVSSAHEAAMEQLSNLQKSIADYKDAIDNAFAAGECKNKEVELSAQVQSIETLLTSLAGSWDSEYKDAVGSDNLLRKQEFDAAITETTGIYNEAVTLIAKLSKTSSAAGHDDILQEVGGADGIYSYADKLRAEITAANTEFADAQNNLPQLYDPEKLHTTNMQDYKLEIETQRDKYVAAVNQTAIATFDAIAADVEAKVNAEKAIMRGWGWNATVVNNAFANITTPLKEAKADKVNPDFAYNLDNTYLVTFSKESIDQLILAGREAAAVVQWNREITTIDALIAAEQPALANFKPEDAIATYIERYAENVEMYEQAKAEKAGLVAGTLYDNMVDLEAMFSSFRNLTTFAEDGKEHTAIYQAAYLIDKRFHANDDAYNITMLGAINAVQAELDACEDYVTSLIVAHNTIILERIKTQQRQINGIKATAEDYHNINQATLWADDIVNECKTVSAAIVSIYNEVVEQEKNAMAKEIELLKFDYDMAVAKLLEGSKDVAVVDVYKTRIAEYTATNELLRNEFIDGKTDENGILLNPAVKATKEETHAAYLELETKVATDRYALAEIYNNALAGTVKTELDAALAVVEAKYNEIEKAWSDLHTPVQENFVEAKDAFKAAIEAERTKIQESADAKTILLYESVLKGDIEAIDAEYGNLLSSINVMEEPYDINDNRYAVLNKTLEALQAELDRVNTVASEYEYAWELEDYRIDEYEALQELIADDKADLDVAYANIALKSYTTLANANNVKTRTADLERYLAYYNALPTIDDVRAAVNRVNLTTLLYRLEDQRTLNAEKNRLRTACSNMSIFNEDVYNYKYIYADINGNPVYHVIASTGEEVDGDYYTDYMKAYAEVMAKVATLKADIETLKTNADELGYKRGDANLDREINVADYAEVRNIALEITNVDSNSIQFHAADVNNDGMVNIGDVVKVSNLILYGNMEGNAVAPNLDLFARNSLQSEDVLSLAVEGTGTTQRIVINLDNARDYVGMQMDIKLPEGVTIVGETLGARVESHDLLTHDIDGVHRVMVSTLDNTLMGNNGSIVYIDVEVSGDYKGASIEVGNVLCADANARTYEVKGIVSGDATGITELNAVEKVTSKIYNVGGQMIDTLKKGINIIVNSDGTTKKVLKK